MWKTNAVKFNPLMAEYVMGQDHEWWVWQDGWYYPTCLSWNKYDEEEIIAWCIQDGLHGDWINEDDPLVQDL